VIVEWFVLLAAQLWEGITNTLPPASSVDGVVITADRFLAPMAAGIASTSAWVPWGTLAVCLPIVAALYAGSFTVKLLRAIAAHIPFIGGAG